MLGAIVNTITVILGSTIGLIFKKGIPEKMSSAIMSAMGIFTLCIGIMGIFKGENVLVLLVSTILGVMIGELIDIDKGINKLAAKVEAKTKGPAGGFSQGFITATLLFCVGAMTVVGSIQAGTTGDKTMLYAKSIMDFISSIMLSVSMGIGVLGAAIAVFVIEGGITLLSTFIAPVLNDTLIAEMTCVGSLMMIPLGLNILGITKLKVANYLPGIILAPFISVLFAALNIG